MISKMKELEKAINYTFKNNSLLQNALVHKSYSNENLKYRGNNNEKLELLGDSVLNLVATEYLYFNFEHLSEGDLVKLKSKVISEPILLEFSISLSLGEHLLLSRGETINGGRTRPSILADAFEALVGSIYIDSGLEQVKNFLIPLISKKLNSITNNKILFDYKTTFQEYVQLKYKDVPKYKVIECNGPDHMKVFKVTTELNGKIMGQGRGKTKKQAEQNTAKNACKKLNIKVGYGNSNNEK